MRWNELIGRRVGPYELLEEIGRGGTSRVFRARDHQRDGDVAIKIIPNDAEDRQTFTQRLLRETEIVRKLNHPNIVHIFDVGETDEFVFLAMGLVQGMTLRQRATQRMSAQEAAQYMIQVAYALHHAHQQGIVHRDVKPSNMLIPASDPALLLLTDFGTAKILGARGPTKTGATIGTPEYMSPEQAEGREVDQRTDIYSLGCSLYEALAGRPPFIGATPVSVLYQQVHAQPTYIRSYNADVPRELWNVLRTCLAKRPEDRYGTAQRVAEELTPFAEGLIQPTPAPWRAPATGRLAMEGLDQPTNRTLRPLSPQQPPATPMTPMTSMPAPFTPAPSPVTPANYGQQGAGQPIPTPRQDTPAAPYGASGLGSGALGGGYPPQPPVYGPGGNPAYGPRTPRTTKRLSDLDVPPLNVTGRLPANSGPLGDLPGTPGRAPGSQPMGQRGPVSGPGGGYQGPQSGPMRAPNSGPGAPGYRGPASGPMRAPSSTPGAGAGYRGPASGPIPPGYRGPASGPIPPGYRGPQSGPARAPISTPANMRLAPGSVRIPGASQPVRGNGGRGPRRSRRATALGGIVAAALIVVAALLAAAGLGMFPGGATTAHTTPKPTATAIATATIAPTATATTPPQPTATPTADAQQLLNQQAAAAFKGVTIAPYSDASCAASNQVTKYNAGAAVFVNLCTGSHQMPGPVTVVARSGGAVVYTLYSNQYLASGASYSQGHTLPRGSYDMFITMNINGKTAVVKDVSFTIG